MRNDEVVESSTDSLEKALEEFKKATKESGVKAHYPRCQNCGRLLIVRMTELDSIYCWECSPVIKAVEKANNE